MLKNRLFWTGVLMPGSLAGWAFVISGFFINYEGWLWTAWIAMLGVWGLVHPLEIIMSYGIGRGRNLSPAHIVIKTILFGFTWWLPLKMGVIER